MTAAYKTIFYKAMKKNSPCEITLITFQEELTYIIYV